MNKNSIFLLNNEYLQKDLQEPHWADMVYSFLPKELIAKSKVLQYKFTSPYSFFLKGVSFEYGVLTKIKEVELAYENYKIGAERNEAYCNLRLFFLHLFKNKDFSFVEINNDDAIYYLLCAFAFYNDDDEPRFRNFFSICLNIVNKYEPDFLKKVELLFQKFKYQPNINFY